jgi:16S rRNA (adenine1518-N6/adenine1519-N6)-dimethyltransferase
VDGNIVRKIVRAANLSPNDIVVEIGPGAGTLTCLLAKNVKMVIAIEVDQRLSPVLKENLDGLTNVEIVFEDAMKVDFDHLVGTKSQEIIDPHTSNYKVVANLPYYITTPLLMYLLQRKFHFESLLVMVQREVSRRLTAVPGSKDYGSLSVAVQYYTVPKTLFYVPRSVFFPQPEVDSAVVYLARRKTPAVEIPAEDLFFSLVRGAFGQRRKTILNALAGSQVIPGFSRQVWEEILKAGNIDPSRRGELLSLEEFAVLSWHCWEQLS